MRLCFGTFANVLRLCRLEGISDRQLVGTMTRTIDPDCKYFERGNETSVSRLLSCEGNFPVNASEGGSGAYQQSGDRLSSVAQLALTMKTEDIVLEFQKLVLPFIDEDKKNTAVLALRDIIQRDLILDEEKSLTFEKYLGVKKETLLSQSTVVLPEFLAGIFLYTVVAIKNTAGKHYVKEIDEGYIAKFKADSWLVNIVNEWETPKLPSRESSITLDDEKIDSTGISFDRYIYKTKEKYSTIKTLLYSDQPREFYDFYVCNNIERRIPTHSRFGASYRTERFENITIKKLTECSRFIILSGTGGLGKSMMMRHLLLDSLEHQKETGVIPIFIPLKDFDGSIPDLFEYIYMKIESLGGGISEREFEAIIEEGLCLLLFDGLDEIGTDYANIFESSLEAFTDKYPDNCYIISSRPYQSFISYSRFTVLELKPFSREQAVKLVGNLEFRLDEPMIKEKFLSKLEGPLYWTHREFTQNPLLLTIMLMTFEQFAEIPSKMHIFYREAYSALSIKHDASKGAYRRELKTGLNADKFADYFAEFCSRSYHDEKFEFSELEFEKYYNDLKERKKVRNEATTYKDFLYDICSNMCLMYFESGKYHFTHRSFQEYFCALYFSKQKDKTLKSIGNFFENRHSRTYGDKTFSMLYDMIPEKMDEYIFIPFLEDLFSKCDQKLGYWTFLKIMYPCIVYMRGDTNDSIHNSPKSYIFNFIRYEKDIFDTKFDFEDLPHIDSLIISEYAYIDDIDEGEVLVDYDEIDHWYKWDYGDPDVVGWVFEFCIDDIILNRSEYQELLDALENDEFALKLEYERARAYYESLLEKQTPEGDSLFDLF